MVLETRVKLVKAQGLSLPGPSRVIAVVECERTRSHLSAGGTAMMRPSHELPKVYLCRDPVDMRNAIDGLAVLDGYDLSQLKPHRKLA